MNKKKKTLANLDSRIIKMLTKPLTIDEVLFELNKYGVECSDMDIKGIILNLINSNKVKVLEDWKLELVK